MRSNYWKCRKCPTRNPRTKRKCVECGAPRPKRPVRQHQKALRDLTYEDYRRINEQIHGISDESCGVCSKPRSQERRHDRDHDHRLARPRGLACGGNQGCNILMLPWVTAAAARGIAEAKTAAGEPDAERWRLIYEYLARVDNHYRAADAA